MKTYRQSGDTLSHVAGSDISGGDVVVMSDTVGIAYGDIPSGEQGAVAIVGAYEVPKVTGTGWTQGQRLAWDASAGGFIPTASLTSDTGDVTDCAIAAADEPGDASVAVATLMNPGMAQ